MVPGPWNVVHGAIQATHGIQGGAAEPGLPTVAALHSLPLPTTGLPSLNAKPPPLLPLLQTQTPSQLAMYLVPQPGIEPVTPAVELQFLNH